MSGFVEKNNDQLNRDLCCVMYQSEHPLLKILFPEGNPKRLQSKRPASIANQFKISMGALTKNINSKQLNFIKCLKPNHSQEASLFEMSLIQHQIRYHLLIEFCRLTRNGYAHRQDYDSFLARYKLLCHVTWPYWPGMPHDGITVLLKHLPICPSEVAFGKSKIFIKSLRTVSPS